MSVKKEDVKRRRKEKEDLHRSQATRPHKREGIIGGNANQAFDSGGTFVIWVQLWLKS